MTPNTSLLMRKRQIKSWFYGILSLFLLSTLFPAWVFCTPEPPEEEARTSPIQTAIRLRLDGRTAETLTCQGETLCGIQLLPKAYQKRDYLPLWISGSRPMPQAQYLLDTIGRASEDGLDPEDYHQNAIRLLMTAIADGHASNKPIPPEWLADLDLTLTDAFLLLGAHLATGRVNPESLHVDWKINPGTVDLISALDQFTTPGADMGATIDALRPPYREYHALRKALAKLRSLAAADGWRPVSEGNTLRPGEHHPAITTLRHRLIASGDMPPHQSKADERLYDAMLVSAVKRFQQRNGLDPDGVVGQKTFGMLNVPIEQRIRQVVLNLERWRWLPRNLGNRYVIINTADFKLDAMENGEVSVSMRVVVGRPARRSPVFSANITYMVINPYWTVPPTIAAEDILPELKKDVSYLATHNIRVFQGWQSGTREIDPRSVNWHAYHGKRLPFRFRQDPGPHNALGRIKFMFPNSFSVYLHDTPHRSLFRRAQRDFSSGCIRVESPLALADFVLAGDPIWTKEKLAELIKSGETKTIWLRHPVPVHLLYMTAWADDKGNLQFRNDIYHRDEELQLAFSQRQPNRPPAFTSLPKASDLLTNASKQKT